MDIHVQDHLKIARWLAKVMDSQFSLFGISFGFDSIIGLVPGIGDVITTVLSFYLLWIGFKLGMPKEKLTEMFRNIAFDTVVGLIPFVGDIADVFIQANVKNLKILEKFVADRGGLIDGVLSG
jgi:hypothetical protein